MALPSAAIAGGWWSFIQLDGRHVATGETVTARAGVMFGSVEEADTARTSGEYYAYLVRGVDRNQLADAMGGPQPERWWTAPDEMILVGDVRLSRWDVNIALATAELRIPQVSPGRYGLMFCDAGCVHPLADLIPRLDVEVSASALAARTANKLERVQGRVQTIGPLREKLLAAQEEAAEATSNADDASASAAVSQAAVRHLQRQLRTLEADEEPSVWVASAGSFLAGLAVAVAAFVIRHRSLQSDPPSGGHAKAHERARHDAAELVSRP